MLSMTDPPSKALTGALAALIAVVLGIGVLRAATFDEDTGEDQTDEPADEEAERPTPQPTTDQAVLEADRRAFDLILANMETCKNRYLPDAKARHDQSVAQLREQEAALNRIIQELPPGRAKDSLSAQVRPDFDSAIRVIEADYKAVETRCQLAFTVYTLTHDTLPRPVPENLRGPAGT